MQPLRVLVADDHEIVRRGLRTLIEAQPGWQVIAEASNGREAVEKARTMKPNVLVLDIGMPLLNGLEAARQILKNDPRSKILILTMHDSEPLIREVLDAGARGYTLKTDANRDLVAAINAVHSNKTFFTAKVAQIKHLKIKFLQISVSIFLPLVNEKLSHILGGRGQPIVASLLEVAKD